MNKKVNKDDIKLFKACLTDIKDKNLKKTCVSLMEYPEFWYWPGSIGAHHSYVGGLVSHTFEVLDYALDTAYIFGDSNNKVNTDILAAAALWHDLAKIWDYELIEKIDILEDQKYCDCGFDEIEAWVKSDYHRKVHHIAGSVAEFTAAAKANNVDLKSIQSVQHCILSHHGFNKDFGSPRVPESLEAIILHQADTLSASWGHYKNERYKPF